MGSPQYPGGTCGGVGGRGGFRRWGTCGKGWYMVSLGFVWILGSDQATGRDFDVAK